VLAWRAGLLDRRTRQLDRRGDLDLRGLSLLQGQVALRHLKRHLFRPV